jgi:hypothetical protein
VCVRWSALLIVTTIVEVLLLSGLVRRKVWQGVCIARRKKLLARHQGDFHSLQTRSG